MHPIRFEGAQDFGKPEGWDDERDGPCHVLPGKVEVLSSELFEVQSVWTFTDEERSQIAAGANISLRCCNGQPPVMLDVVTITGPSAWPQDFEQQSAEAQHIENLIKLWDLMLDTHKASDLRLGHGAESIYKSEARKAAQNGIDTLLKYMDVRARGHAAYADIEAYIAEYTLRGLTEAEA